MSNKEFILEQLLEVSHHPVVLGAQGIGPIEQLAEEIMTVLQNQARIFFVGKEPYKKVTELLAGEFKSGFALERPELPIILIKSEIHINWDEASGNGILAPEGEESIQPGDLLVFIIHEVTTELMEIITWARSNKIKSVVLCGQSGPKQINPDLLFYAPLSNRSRVKELFIIFGHLVGTVVESVLFSDGS